MATPKVKSLISPSLGLRYEYMNVPLCFRYPERGVVLRRLDLYLRLGRRRDGLVLEEPNNLQFASGN